MTSSRREHGRRRVLALHMQVRVGPEVGMCTWAQERVGRVSSDGATGIQ